jgi:hypothetical protein
MPKANTGMNGPERFVETSNNFKGSKVAATKTDSQVTILVSNSAKEILRIAKVNNTTPEAVAETVLTNSGDVLEQYIRSKGEVPNDTIQGIIAQAALLRMDDIATISAATDISEDSALREIEEAESEAVELNTPDKENVLNPQIQASLNIVINNLLSKMKQAAGTTDIKGAMKLISQRMATPLNNVRNPDNAVGPYLGRPLGPVESNSFQGPFTGNASQPGDSPYKGKPVGVVEANYAIGDDLFPSGIINPTTPTVQLTNPTTVNADDNSSSIWDILTGIAQTASAVAGAVKQVGGAVQQTGTAVSGTVNTLGGGAVNSGLNTYVKQNWIYIVVVIIVMILIIILVARGINKK